MKRVALVVVSLILCGSCGDEPTNNGGVQGQEPASTARPAAEGAEVQAIAPVDGGVMVYRVEQADDESARVASMALVNPSNGTEMPVPDPPFEAALDEHSIMAADGDHVFLMGVLCDQIVISEDDEGSSCEPGGIVAAAYSLTEKEWDAVDLPDEVASLDAPFLKLSGVTAGGLVIVQAQEDGVPTAEEAPFWTFDLSNGSREWAPVESPQAVVDAACVAHNRLVVSTSTFSSSGAGIDNVSLRVKDLQQPSEPWEEIAPVPGTEFLSSPGVGCAKTFAIIYGPPLESELGLAVRVFRHSIGDDPDSPSGWVEYDPVPEALGYTLDFVATGDDGLLVDVDSGSGARLPPTGTGWQAVDVPASDAALAPVWTGDELIVAEPKHGDALIAEVAVD